MQIDISELTPQAQELLSKIHASEELIITADNQPIAKIVSINGQAAEQNDGKRKRRRAGTAKGNFWMAPDFNEPLEDFAEYYVMKLLLDTHAFIWFAYDAPELPRPTRELLEDGTTELLLSLASVWERCIKASTGKLLFGVRVVDFVANQLEKDDINLLPITLAHLNLIQSLPFHHKDPFDRLLIAQTQFEQISIVSNDTKFDSYGIERLWLK